MAPPYEFIYYTGVPGRGEYFRLILEKAGVQYKDTQSLSFDEARKNVATWLPGGGHGNPPYFAPSLFKHGDLVISQTPNILLYLDPKLGLSGSREDGLYRVNALALTALDLLKNEVHDTYHSIAMILPWEDQKEENKRCSKKRRVLENEESGTGPWLLGGTFIYIDSVLFQTLDGTHCAFSKAMKQARETGKYGIIFKLYEDVKARPGIGGYGTLTATEDRSVKTGASTGTMTIIM